MERSEFGRTKDNQVAYLYKIANNNRMVAYITDYGATIVSLYYEVAPGEYVDVVLGYDSVSDYERNTCYFGATIGRNSNRVEDSFVLINNQKFLLEANERNNNLHSGSNGYSHRIWEVKEHGENYIEFHLFSPHLDQGFPGDLDVILRFTLTDENAISIEYKGVSSQDTVMNLTNHSYFNLNGHKSGSVENHKLYLSALEFTGIKDHTCIPSGDIIKVEGTPMDFNKEKIIGEDIEEGYQQLAFTGGYDHNYILNKKDSKSPLAVATGELTKIVMELYTDMPGVQFYAGNFISGSLGKEEAEYGKRHGFCLETQFFPDATKHASFPSPILKANETFHSTTTYQFYNK